MDRTERIVRRIGEEVRKYGIKAVLNFTKEFDGINLKKFVYDKNDFLKAFEEIEPDLRKTYKRVYKNISYYHKKLKENYIKDTTIEREGVKIRFVFVSLEKIGIYVPGGKYPYPSTIFMTVIPAKISGVKKIFVVTPPKNLNKEILAACFLTGVDKLYSIGGAQAIFSLAYGITPFEKVDKIIGPGNKFVNEAKRQVFGASGIDTLAGPSEIAVLLLNKNFNYEILKTELLAQLEHGEETSSYFVTTIKEAYNRVKKDLKQVKLFYFRDKNKAIEKINEIAPEHLLFIGDKRDLKKIKNSGAIFVGENSSVSFGDYVAGPSHVLPTNKSAKFSSGLTIFDFYKTRAEIFYTKKGVLNDFKDAINLAKIEGMKFHEKSASLRREG